MAKRKPKNTAVASTMGVCGHVMRAGLKNVTREIVFGIVGDRTVGTMPEVAKEFGVSPQTVRQGWRPAGMPVGKGKYHLAEILLWKLLRDKENEKHGPKQGSDRIKEIELRKAEIELQEIEIKAAERSGLIAPVEKSQRELRAMIVVTREALLSIPRAVMPLLPADQAEVVAGVIKNKISHVVTSLAEMSARQILKEGKEDVK